MSIFIIVFSCHSCLIPDTCYTQYSSGAGLISISVIFTGAGFSVFSLSVVRSIFMYRSRPIKLIAYADIRKVKKGAMCNLIKII